VLFWKVLPSGIWSGHGLNLDSKTSTTFGLRCIYTLVFGLLEGLFLSEVFLADSCLKLFMISHHFLMAFLESCCSTSCSFDYVGFLIGTYPLTIPTAKATKKAATTTTMWIRRCFVELSGSNIMNEALYNPGGGGTLGISGWGWAAGTLEPLVYTRASSAEFCWPILE